MVGQRNGDRPRIAEELIAFLPSSMFPWMDGVATVHVGRPRGWRRTRRSSSRQSSRGFSRLDATVDRVPGPVPNARGRPAAAPLYATWRSWCFWSLKPRRRYVSITGRQIVERIEPSHSYAQVAVLGFRNQFDRT